VAEENGSPGIQSQEHGGEHEERRQHHKPDGRTDQVEGSLDRELPRGTTGGLQLDEGTLTRPHDDGVMTGYDFAWHHREQATPIEECSVRDDAHHRGADWARDQNEPGLNLEKQVGEGPFGRRCVLGLRVNRDDARDPHATPGCQRRVFERARNVRLATDNDDGSRL